MNQKEQYRIWEIGQDQKKSFIVNKPKEDKDQAFEIIAEREKCIELKEDMSLSRSSISISMRLGCKLKF